MVDCDTRSAGARRLLLSLLCFLVCRAPAFRRDPWAPLILVLRSGSQTLRAGFEPSVPNDGLQRLTLRNEDYQAVSAKALVTNAGKRADPLAAPRAIGWVVAVGGRPSWSAARGSLDTLLEEAGLNLLESNLNRPISSRQGEVRRLGVRAADERRRAILTLSLL